MSNAAFPHISVAGHRDYEPGMSLRDYFAAKAMNGMLAHATRYKPRHTDIEMGWHAAMAKEAYEIADAMISAIAR